MIEVIFSMATGKLWINSDVDGSSIARVCLRAGIDLHLTATEQAEIGKQCLYCTAGVLELEQFLTFEDKLASHYDVLLKPYISEYFKANARKG